jgi:cysteine desulfurase
MKRKVYLDYAATAPLDTQVLEVMLPYFKEKFGNASSLHSWGQEARAAVDEAREQIAKILNCQPQEIIFTGTTTEADNLAVQGVNESMSQCVKEKVPHIVVSPIEHHGILDVVKHLEEMGRAETTLLPVDRYGLVNPEDVKKSVRENTVLISVMYANNEVGTIEPIAEIAKVTRKINTSPTSHLISSIVFHTDAVAAKYLDLDVQKLGVDLMTLGSHKFYGPKGIGILFVRKGTKIESVIKGGAHEYGLRPGTENVPAIVGAAKALQLLEEEKSVAAKRLTQLRDRLIGGILQKISGSHLTGHPEKRVPDIASFVVEGAEGEAMLLGLDQEGIAASSGSACTSGILEPSHVLTAMGIAAELAHGSLRISLGKQTTEEDIDYVLEKLPPIVERLRSIAPK